jgi:hypothetical protein
MDHEPDVNFSLQQKPKIIEGNKRLAPEAGGRIVGHDNDAHAATLLGTPIPQPYRERPYRVVDRADDL